MWKREGGNRRWQLWKRWSGMTKEVRLWGRDCEMWMKLAEWFGKLVSEVGYGAEYREERSDSVIFKEDVGGLEMVTTDEDPARWKDRDRKRLHNCCWTVTNRPISTSVLLHSASCCSLCAFDILKCCCERRVAIRPVTVRIAYKLFFRYAFTIFRQLETYLGLHV